VTDVPCAVLEWDSAFFDCTVAKVTTGRLDERTWHRVDSWCHEHHVDWLYFLAEADDATTVSVVQAAGFAFVDIRLELAAQIGNLVPPPPLKSDECVLRNASPDDVRELEEIAASVHTDSRFFFDARVPRHRAEALYRAWIRRSVAGDLADYVIVAEYAHRPAGYITGKYGEDGVGQIGLLGLNPAARGRSIGHRLIEASLRSFANRHVDRVMVVTQGRNVGAQRAYARCGFLPTSVRLWYHKWFP
jgi:dTDP-4-amino-4,6-dideoxy-D-galactose acyltransferase